MIQGAPGRSCSSGAAPGSSSNCAPFRGPPVRRLPLATCPWLLPGLLTLLPGLLSFSGLHTHSRMIPFSFFSFSLQTQSKS